MEINAVQFSLLRENAVRMNIAVYLHVGYVVFYCKKIRFVNKTKLLEYILEDGASKMSSNVLLAVSLQL